MITIKNLAVGYRKNNVIDSLDLILPGNAIHGIVGLNGSGKTTLFNAVFGLKNVRNGEILYDNRPVGKKDIAYLPAENYFYSGITGREYLKLFRSQTFDVEQWNKLFTLPLDRITDEYSTGMKKKLALLGIIKQDKPIIMLDEPFNGLDIEMYRIIRLILLRLKETGKTIIISSHIIETLTNLCDYIHRLENGRIECSAPRADFEAFEKEFLSRIEKDSGKLVNLLIKINHHNARSVFSHPS